VADIDDLSLALANVAEKLRYHVYCASKRTSEPEEDLENVANVAACKAWRRYDPTKGAWPTYADRCIAGELKNYLASRGVNTKGPDGEPLLSYDDQTACQCTQAVSVAVLAVSSNPTIQRPIRLTRDVWDKLDGIARRNKTHASNIVQQAVDVFLKYLEAEHARSR
jgi:hypothetical protein